MRARTSRETQLQDLEDLFSHSRAWVYLPRNAVSSSCLLCTLFDPRVAEYFADSPGMPSLRASRYVSHTQRMHQIYTDMINSFRDPVFSGVWKLICQTCTRWSSLLTVVHVFDPEDEYIRITHHTDGERTDDHKMETTVLDRSL